MRSRMIVLSVIEFHILLTVSISATANEAWDCISVWESVTRYLRSRKPKTLAYYLSKNTSDFRRLESGEQALKDRLPEAPPEFEYFIQPEVRSGAPYDVSSDDQFHWDSGLAFVLGDSAYGSSTIGINKEGFVIQPDPGTGVLFSGNGDGLKLSPFIHGAESNPGKRIFIKWTIQRRPRADSKPLN